MFKSNIHYKTRFMSPALQKNVMYSCSFIGGYRTSSNGGAMDQRIIFMQL